MSRSRVVVWGSALLAAAGLSALSSLDPWAAASSSRAELLVAPTRFACYGGQFFATPAQQLSLVDGVAGRLTARVYAPDEICAPAAHSAGRVPESTSYLTCFRIRATTTFKSRTVRASDEFRTAAKLSLSRPATMCTPSVRVDAGSVTRSTTLNRFVCYPSRPTPVVHRDGVSIVDAFATSDDSITGAYRFCSPAAKSFAPRTRPLTCYAVESRTKGTSIVIRNELGYLRVALGPRARLCVTATLS